MTVVTVGMMYKKTSQAGLEYQLIDLPISEINPEMERVANVLLKLLKNITDKTFPATCM